MLIFGHNMTSRVHFGWKPTTTAIFVGIRHVGVNAPHHFSQKPPLKGHMIRAGCHTTDKKLPIPQKSVDHYAFSESIIEYNICRSTDDMD